MRLRLKKKIFDIYSTDDIDPQKIKNVKLPAMSLPNLNRRVLFFELRITNPAYRKKDVGTKISTTVENVKRKIRQKYKTKVQNYVYDTIIHVTDNTTQSTQIKSLLRDKNTNITSRYLNYSYLLYCQFLNAQFGRPDIAVRLHSIQQLYSLQKENENDFELYSKMQQLRKGSVCTNCVANFKKLIQSMSSRVFDSNTPIILGKDKKLIDGSHRMACSYYFKIPFVVVKLTSRPDPGYTYKWFSQHSQQTTNTPFFTRSDLIKILKCVTEMQMFVNKNWK